MATGLLVGANATSKFIIEKLPKGNHENISTTLQEIDWKTFSEGTAALGSYAVQGVKAATPVLVAIRNVLVTLTVAAHSAFDTARVALSNQQNSSVDESSPEGASVITEVEPVGTAKEKTGMLFDSQEESSGNLKHRTPFSDDVDDDETKK